MRDVDIVTDVPDHTTLSPDILSRGVDICSKVVRLSMDACCIRIHLRFGTSKVAVERR